MTRRRRIAIICAAALSLILVAGIEKAAPSAAAAAEPKKADSAKCDRAQFRVILDVGHTMEAPGATSARNALEYDFNLRLAKEIQSSLLEDGFARTTLLVTHGPALLSLVKRVAAANHLSADLFLSIHHDSVPDSYLEKWNYEGAPSHFTDRFKGYSLFVSYENRNLKASLSFGRLLGQELKDRNVGFASQYAKDFTGRYHHELIDPDAGVYRYDKLEVLRSTQMPAVLLEAGSIINRNEEELLNSPEHRGLIVAAVTTAVQIFCDARPSRPAITASRVMRSSGIHQAR